MGRLTPMLYAVLLVLPFAITMVVVALTLAGANASLGGIR